MIALPRNPRPMCKADEKKLYRELILATPENSYLRTVLQDSQGFIFGNIDNDIAWPVYERSRIIDRDIQTSAATLKELKAKVETARKELQKVETDVWCAKQSHRRVLEDTQNFLNKIDEAQHATRRTILEMNK